MSRLLPSGIWSKTGFAPIEEGMVHYAEIEDKQVEITEAVDLLRQAFDDPNLFADRRFDEFRRYIKSFYPVRRFDEDGFSSSERLEPAMQVFPLDIVDLEEDPGPMRQVLGQALTLYDIMSFTHYVLTNTELQGKDDPRAQWLEELRGDRDPHAA